LNRPLNFSCSIPFSFLLLQIPIWAFWPYDVIYERHLCGLTNQSLAVRCTSKRSWNLFYIQKNCNKQRFKAGVSNSNWLKGHIKMEKCSASSRPLDKFMKTNKFMFLAIKILFLKINVLLSQCLRWARTALIHLVDHVFETPAFECF